MQGLSTVVVAVSIAGPFCFICIVIMLCICWHQQRQWRQLEQYRDAEARLHCLDHDEGQLIPTGQTLKDLLDISVGG